MSLHPQVPSARALDAMAEALPLAEGQVDAIVAAAEEPRADVLRRVRALGASRPQPIHLAYISDVHAFRRV